MSEGLVLLGLVGLLLSGGVLLIMGRWILDAWPKETPVGHPPTITIMVHASVWRVSEDRRMSVFVGAEIPFRLDQTLHANQTVQVPARPLPRTNQPSAQCK